jgi:hypothetical protein
MTRHITALLGLAIASLTVATAAQAELRVKCEVRSDRSTASVDGKNLASGNYYAVLTSGANSATSTAQPTRGDEVEIDFSSQPRNINKGATALTRDFIVDRQATGALYTEAGVLVATKTVGCRAR